MLYNMRSTLKNLKTFWAFKFISSFRWMQMGFLMTLKWPIWADFATNVTFQGLGLMFGFVMFCSLMEQAITWIVKSLTTIPTTTSSFWKMILRSVRTYNSLTRKHFVTNITFIRPFSMPYFMMLQINFRMKWFFTNFTFVS